MTIRNLEIFAAVARLGKMSLAAEELHISQPTISQSIAEMEKEYNVILFERLSRKLYITDAGRRLLQYARTILNTAAELDKEMLYLSANKTIRLGATLTVGASVLADIVKKFEDLNQNIKINVFVDNTSVIEERISRGQLDMALVEGQTRDPNMVVIPALKDELILVCGRAHPLASKKKILFSDLAGRPFILREEGSGTRAIFDEKLSRHKIDIMPKWVCNSFDSIIEAVSAGQGLTVISRKIADRMLRQKKLCEITVLDEEFKRTFDLIYHKTKYISDTLRTLINFILQEF